MVKNLHKQLKLASFGKYFYTSMETFYPLSQYSDNCQNECYKHLDVADQSFHLHELERSHEEPLLMAAALRLRTGFMMLMTLLGCRDGDRKSVV